VINILPFRFLLYIRFYIVTFLSPGEVIVITPAPIPHISCELLNRHGLPPASIFGLTGTHVPAGTIEHGCGVNTPSAAAVADATAGLASDEHIPKLGIFTFGCIS
jgi:hypothetical protein